MTQKAVLKFCDTETTRLIDKMPEAEITEIAIVSWCEGEVTVDLHEKVKPKTTKPDARFNKSYDEKAWRGADVWDAAASEAVAALLKGNYTRGSTPDSD